MNWSEILRKGGVPEPPGRESALKAAMHRSQQKAKRKAKSGDSVKKKTK